MQIRDMATSQERRAARVERMARFYQRWISPGLHALSGSLLPMPGGCRFQPTCSEYAAIAVARYGWWRVLRWRAASFALSSAGAARAGMAASTRCRKHHRFIFSVISRSRLAQVRSAPLDSLQADEKTG